MLYYGVVCTHAKEVETTKKQLSLLLALLILFSLSLPSVHADGEKPPAGSDSGSSDDGSNGDASWMHSTPKWGSSLEYWDQVEYPSLTLTGDLWEDVLIIGRSQLGYTADPYCYKVTKSGHRGYYTRYGAWDGATFGDWCDTFVSFCVYYAGLMDYPKESSCGRHMFYLKDAGYWREWNSYIPRPGDLVFFKLDKSSPAPNHVGLVEEVIFGEGDEGGQLITIEGNVANPEGGMTCVRRMTRSTDEVLGYATYQKGTVYPKEYTIRSYGWNVIDEDSVYFIEYPQEEVLQFLGLKGTPYYDYWFPEDPETEATPGPDAEDALPELEEPPTLDDPVPDDDA